MSTGSASASWPLSSRYALMVSALALAHELRGVDGVRLWAKAPLAPFTTIGTGGKANLLVTVGSTPALVATLGLLEASGSPWLCLGAGSNLLVADTGYPGAVVKLDESFHYVEGMPTEPFAEPRRVVVSVGAGTYLARLAAVAAETGLAGLEFACGIPGSIGGGVAMNAGAHGWSLVDVVQEVEVATAAGVHWLPASSLEWGYRWCRLPAESVVTAVRIGLTAGGPASWSVIARSFGSGASRSLAVAAASAASSRTPPATRQDDGSRLPASKECGGAAPKYPTSTRTS